MVFCVAYECSLLPRQGGIWSRANELMHQAFHYKVDPKACLKEPSADLRAAAEAQCPPNGLYLKVAEVGSLQGLGMGASEQKRKRAAFLALAVLECSSRVDSVGAAKMVGSTTPDEFFQLMNICVQGLEKMKKNQFLMF